MNERVPEVHNRGEFPVTSAYAGTITRFSQSQLWPALVMVVLWLIPCLYYATLLTDGSFNFFRRAEHGMIFNSMLTHLSQGRFDVDPDAAAYEGFVHDGRTYAYFGIFCALLRVPLLLSPRLMATDVTTLSVFIAACMGWLFRLLCLRTVILRALPAIAPLRLLIVVYLGFALAGESVQYLRASVYQEVVSWSDAFASAFVFIALNIVLGRRPGWLYSLGMAAISGLALLTRVSTGLGLYVTTGLILLVELSRDTWFAGNEVKHIRAVTGWASAFIARCFTFKYMTTVALLLLFAGITGVINYYRWGNPLTFADFHTLPPWAGTFIHILEKYGEFNILRLPFGIVYYFFPIWIIPTENGTLLFAGNPVSLIPDMELPPSSFLLSDSLIVILAGYCCYAVMRHGREVFPDARMAAATLAGLAVPPALMLTAVSMTLRYRMEFYPQLDAAAYLGLFALVSSGVAYRMRSLQLLVAGAAFWGIAWAHITLLLYKISAWIWASHLNLSQGWFAFIRGLLKAFYPSIGHVVDSLVR